MEKNEFFPEEVLQRRWTIYDAKAVQRIIFNMGVMAGNQCKSDLCETDFSEYLGKSIEYTRHKLGIDVPLLKGCYAIEKKCFKDIQHLILKPYVKA